MPIALIRKGLALIELGRSADLAALIPTLQRQRRRGPLRRAAVALVIDGAAMIGGNAAAKRAALDRLEQQALNLSQPVHGVSPGPGLARETRPHRRGPRRPRTSHTSMDGSLTTSCACRRTSRHSPPTSGSSERSPSRAPSSTTPSRCSRRPTRDRSCRRSCGSHWPICCARSGSHTSFPSLDYSRAARPVIVRSSRKRNDTSWSCRDALAPADVRLQRELASRPMVRAGSADAASRLRPRHKFRPLSPWATP